MTNDSKEKANSLTFLLTILLKLFVIQGKLLFLLKIFYGMFSSMAAFSFRLNVFQIVNICIAPLRHKGSMTNDSKEKANILNDQFKSVFTKSTSTTLEKSTIDRDLT
jgi:hypothetical protein